MQVTEIATSRISDPEVALRVREAHTEARPHSGSQTSPILPKGSPGLGLIDNLAGLGNDADTRRRSKVRTHTLDFICMLVVMCLLRTCSALVLGLIVKERVEVQHISV